MEHPHEQWITFENRKKKLSLFNYDAEALRDGSITKDDVHAGSCYRKNFLFNRLGLG